jgi:hypothetical protein
MNPNKPVMNPHGYFISREWAVLNSVFRLVTQLRHFLLNLPDLDANNLLRLPVANYLGNPVSRPHP